MVSEPDWHNNPWDHCPLGEPYIAPSSLGVVIRKRGLFYRPEWKGYTSNFAEAGRYDRAVAERHAAKVEGVTVHEYHEFLIGNE